MSNYTSKHSGVEIDAAVEKLQGPLSIAGGGTGSETAEGAVVSLGIREELDDIKYDANVMRNHGVYTGDLDSAPIGFFYVSPSCVNKPDGYNYGTCLNLKGAADTWGQLYFDYASGKILTRAGNSQFNSGWVVH